MTRPIKKIISEFESYNHSSIQPLPPISSKNAQNEPTWENKQLSLGDLGTINVRNSLEKRQNEIKRGISASLTPHSSSGAAHQHEFYVNQELPTARGYVPEPLFELTKKDAYEAQNKIHQEIVKNDMIDFKSTNLDTTLYENKELDKVLHLIKSEIALFHNNSFLLNQVFSGYTEFLDHLLYAEKPVANNVLSNQEDLNKALDALKIREDKALEAIELIKELEKPLPSRPVMELEVIKVVEPTYMNQTCEFIQLGHQIQEEINSSEALSAELKDMSSWNPKLEENLILEEREIDSRISRIEADLMKLKSIEYLDKIHEKVIQEKELQDRGPISEDLFQVVNQVWPSPRLKTSS